MTGPSSTLNAKQCGYTLPGGCACETLLANLGIRSSMAANNECELLVVVRAARNLAAKDSNGLSDPYAIVGFWDAEHHKWCGDIKPVHTPIARKTLDPWWDEAKSSWKFRLHASHRILKIELWDKDTFTPDDFLGQVELSVDTDIPPNLVVEEWHSLQRRPGKREKVHGEVLLRLHLKDPTKENASTFPTQPTSTQDLQPSVVPMQPPQEIPQNIKLAYELFVENSQWIGSVTSGGVSSDYSLTITSRNPPNDIFATHTAFLRTSNVRLQLYADGNRIRVLYQDEETQFAGTVDVPRRTVEGVTSQLRDAPIDQSTIRMGKFSMTRAGDP